MIEISEKEISNCDYENTDFYKSTIDWIQSEKHHHSPESNRY